MDPFSAATGIAGLISLGIELGKGLKTYCEDFQSMDDDITLLSQHANRFGTFVQMLNTRVEGQDQVDPALFKSLKQCYDACNVCLQDFGVLSAKYCRNPGTKPKGVRERWEAALTHFHYPVQKKRFEALEAKMENFQSQLSARLQLLNYDGTIKLRNRITAENARLLSAIEPLPQIKQAIDQLPGVLVSQIVQALKSDLILEMESSSQLCSAAVERRKLDVLGSVSDMQQASFIYGNHPSTTSNLACVATNTQENTQSVSSTTGLESPREMSPTRLMVAALSQAGQYHPRRFQYSRFHGFECTCKPTSPRYRPASQRSRDTNHRRDCPVAFLNRNRASAAGNYILKTIFRCLASITHYRIEYNFTARAVVPGDSPAFRLIKKLNDLQLTRNENQLESRCLTILTDLKEIFQQQRGWPTDTTSNDMNFLHWACSRLRNEWSAPMAHVYFKFLEALVNMGVPVNGTGSCGTPLRWLLNTGCFRQLRLPNSPVALPYVARGLIGLDAYYAEDLSDSAYERAHNSSIWIFSLIYGDLSGSLEAFDYGELCCALFRKSEASVLQIMRASPDHIFERGHHNQTPLHIAVFWPDGLRLLFELAEEACQDIIDEEDKTGLTAIQCAIAWQQAESVKFLLEKRASINLENTENFFTSKALFPLSHQTATICEILATELAKHRKSMRDYAFDQLPDENVGRFQLGHKAILQGEAYDVIASLMAEGVWVPEGYKLVRPGSIYHSPIMTATLAEALFQAGFHDVDFMWQGYTPLMVVACWDLRETSTLIAWLDEHQASFLTPIPHVSGVTDDQNLNTNKKGFKVIHRLAYILGLWTELYYRQPPPLSRRFFSSAPKDPCRCYCAPDGCTPASLLAKGCLQAMKYKGQLNQGAFSVHGQNLGLLHEENQDISADVVRVFTFERLGMRHTCCEHNDYDGFKGGFDTLQAAMLDGFVSVMDPSEMAEIRGEACDNGNAGEDRYLAKHLEELMTEFGAALEDMKDSEEFWDFWDDRMDSFEREKPMMSRKSRQALLDLGVRLERVQEIESDEETYSVVVSEDEITEDGM